MAPEKLAFEIYRFSGEDEEHPAKELLLSAAQPRGWHSQKLCKYPQELVLKLGGPSRVTQIQILAHEYKIPTKVEIFTGMPRPGAPPLPENCSMKKLGHLSFDSNERSNHQARELKSVHINTKALLLRFVLLECHVNRMNAYNQVGLIAINIKGERLPDIVAAPMDMPTKSLPDYSSPVQELPVNVAQNVRSGPVPTYLKAFDPLTAAKIAEVQRAKEYAVEKEDYDEAKRLKAKIDYMKRVGSQIGELEATKKAAVQNEDYDKAKALKLEIAQMRRLLETQPSAATPVPAQGAVQEKGNSSPIMAQEGGAPAASEDSQEQPTTTPIPMNPLSPERDVSYDHLPYDERPAKAKGMMNVFITPDRFKGSPTAKQGEDNSGPPEMPINTDVAFMQEGDARMGEPILEALSSTDEKDASLLFALIGEEAARCIHSKHWQLREKGLSETADVIQSGDLQIDSREAFRLISRNILGRTLKDKVAHIVQTSVDCLGDLLAKQGSQVGSREVQHALLDLVPILIDRVGESNARIRDIAFEAIETIADTPEIGNGGVLAASLLKPVKRQSQWKPIASRLTLLQNLLPRFGLSQQKADDGFTVEAVMAFINPTLSSANGEVRNLAIQVARIVQDSIGPQALEKMMPKELNPYVKDAILDNNTQPVSSAVPKKTPAKSKHDAKATPRAPKSSNKNVSRPSEGASSVKKAQEPKSKPQGQAQTPQQAKPDKENMIPQNAPPPPQDQFEVLQQEISAREAKFGEDHVEVAHALVDLAVLSSEEGRPDDAVPLYERALRIFEDTDGQESSDVAQTLTDLAVIHIEAGRDDIGKPQLERAKAILEKDLGPDHEDVQAIRDVLDNLEEGPTD